MVSATEQPIVHLRGAGRSFAGRRVLSDIDITIHEGEFIVLVGASGCGKSTLLRMIGGLDDGADGDIRVSAEHATVFQDARLLPWRPVWANVVIGLQGRSEDLKRQALAALEEVGLAQQAEAWPLTLSGGEAQRVALARALVRTPKLMLLDEPFAALDALTRLKMQRQVLDLWREHAIAAIFVTHDVEEAILLADKIFLIESGRIAQRYNVELQRPRHRDDKRFSALRRELLARLGVVENDVAEAQRTEKLAAAS